MKRISILTIILAMASAAMAQVTLTLPKDMAGKKIAVQKISVADYAMPRDKRPQPVVDSLRVVKGKVTIPVEKKGAMRCLVMLDQKTGVLYFTEPGDKLTLNVTSISPLTYSIKGSPLMEGIYSLDQAGSKVLEQYGELYKDPEGNKEKLAALSQNYTDLFRNYIKENPKAPASLYAMQNLRSDIFLETFETISDDMKKSTLYPLLVAQKNGILAQMAEEKQRKEMMSGNTEAPGFTFKNTKGEDVSLSDFRGKWVILDFWGTWCGYCIKGFPALKEAYQKYAGKLEVIGIDCNESEEAWKKGVERYKLPWVNVYNPVASVDTGICKEYIVKGFPTKVIINPEGKIANITMGEHPQFYDVLAKLMGE